jgi:FKBP-type peptidyl-prolyl cis-trans isomerase FkpA
MINKKLVMIGLMASAVLVAGCKEDAKKKEPAKLDTLEQKVSYLIGQSIGKNIQQMDVAIDNDILLSAIADVKAGTPSRISDEDSAKIQQEFQELMKKKSEEKQKKLSETNSAEGAKFLAENKTKEGVQTTASGLQYKIITAGTGVKPKATDTVKVHYTGKLLSGKVFDSSVERGEPVEFPVSGVIPGWIEALQLMPQGSKWEVYIPADLAYGATGNQAIPPASTLIFEVELLEVKAAPAAAEEKAAKPAKK